LKYDFRLQWNDISYWEWETRKYRYSSFLEDNTGYNVVDSVNTSRFVHFSSDSHSAAGAWQDALQLPGAPCVWLPHYKVQIASNYDAHTIHPPAPCIARQVGVGVKAVVL